MIEKSAAVLFGFLGQERNQSFLYNFDRSERGVRQTVFVDYPLDVFHPSSIDTRFDLDCSISDIRMNHTIYTRIAIRKVKKVDSIPIFVN